MMKSSKPEKEEKIFIRSAEGKIKKEINLKVELHKTNTHEVISGKALLDCGATGSFMDKEFAAKHGFVLWELEFPIKVQNVDGTWNKNGEITHEVDVILEHDYHTEKATFEVCSLGKNELILGMTWLLKHNPEVNWDTGIVSMTRCPRSCGRHAKEYRRKKAQERLKKRAATKWELREYVQKREKEDDFLLCRDTMDFIQSKEEKYMDNMKTKDIHYAEKVQSSDL